MTPSPPPPPARTYLLDAGIVIALQRAGHLSFMGEVSERAEILLVEEVQDELVRVPPPLAASGKQAAAAIRSSHVKVVSIDVADPAAQILAALTRGKTSASDLGEAASIAWASQNPGAVFVTRDGAAALLALDELRGRALGSSSSWRS